MTKRARLTGGLVAAGFCLVPMAAAAQLTHPVPASSSRVELALSRPSLQDQDLGAATGLLLARLTVPVGAHVSLFAEWGASHASRALDLYSPSPSSYYDPATSSGTVTANLTLGSVFGDPEGTSGSLTGSLPVSHQSGNGSVASGVALFGDVDHVERFAPEAWAVEGALRSSRRLDSGGHLGVRVAAAVVGSGRAYVDTELYGRYALFGDALAGPVSLGAEMSGVALLTEGELDFGQRSHHQLTLSAGLPGILASPHLFVRLPLDSDLRDVVKSVVGLRVTF